LTNIFLGLDLARDAIPDEATILIFDTFWRCTTSPRLCLMPCLDATKVAYELLQDFMTQPTKYTKIDAPNSFKFYAEKLIEKQRREVKTGAKSARFLSDDLKIINREDDGLLTYFCDYYTALGFSETSQSA
jgi:hypothetical protein